ncbi:tail fiber domain-containing protein [Bdellovibrio sp. HCB-110]|uniref:tail fiber domain-containing protein n=1 Tax=Bdellovibrio sp. HCB-110 TaxID=3391182 RepID=UPI0039B3911C
MVLKLLGVATLFLVGQELWASNSVPQLVPFQGRLTETTGTPINYSVTVKYRIYPPTGSCYIYEDTQNVTPNSFGIFSVLIGSTGNSTGPANNFAQIFNNSSAGISNSCAGVYIPVANDWRRIEVLVDGVPFSDMQTVGAAPFAFNSNMLEGKRSTDFIVKDASVTQAALTSLLNGSDASSLHNHDSLYAKIDGSNSYTGNISTSGSIGVGTSSASADVDIQKNSPRLRLGAATGGGGASSIEFYSGTTTQRARIESSENSNVLKFYTGSAEAMSIDSNKNLYVGGSLKSSGTVGLGAYTAAQDATLVTQLTAIGVGATGSLWIESTSGQLRYWDGAAAKTLLSQGNAIDVNASFGGDVSGAYTNLTVNKIKGRVVDETGLAANKILKFDGTKWIMADDNTGWSSSDASYSAKGIVQFDTSAAVSGINVVSGVASVNTGTGANQIVKLDGTSKLPAVDGSQLTNLNASNLSSGTVPVARLPSFNSLSPLTTRGDVLVHNGTNNIRLGVGSDGQALIADSSQASGIKWADILATDIVSLATTGIVQRNGAGSYSTVTVNAPLNYAAGSLGVSVGTTAGSVAAGDDSRITGALQKSGGTMSGAINMGGQYLGLGQYSSDPSTAGWGASEKGRSWFNTTTNQVKYWDGAVVQALGISGAVFSGDVSGILSSTSVDKIKGKDISAPTASGQFMVYDGTSWVNVTMSSDATMSASGAVTLANSGVTAGTYSKVTVDAKGRVTTATNIGSSDVTTALGYNPVSKAGDSMTGALILNSQNEVRFADSDSSNYVGFKSPGTVASNKIWTLPTTDGSSGQVLSTDGSGALSWLSVSGGTVTSVSSATSDISVATGTTTPVLTLNSGTGANQIVKLDGSSKLPAVDGSQLTNLNASNLSSGTLPAARLPALTGDVTSTAGSNSVTLNTVSIAKGGTGQTTQTTAFDALSPLTTKGDVLVHNGTDNIRLGVGSDGQALVADSSQASGIKWADILATDILSLTTTGIVQRNGAGSYSTVTVNAPLSYAAGALGVSLGTSAGTVAAGDDSRITGALQKSGGTMTGAISMGGQYLGLGQYSSDPSTAGWGASEKGRSWFNTTTNQVKYWDGSSVQAIGISGAAFSGDVSGTSSSTSVDKIKGKDISAPTASGQFMVYDGTLWGNVAMSGDATMSAAGAMTLANSGVTVGTYSKVTVDAKGRVTTATNIGSSDVTTALGYTPVNKAGDSMTGALTLNAQNEARFADSDSSNYVGFKSPGTVAANKIWTLPASDGTSGQVLSTDGSGVLSWVSVSGGGGTVTSVSSASSEISVATGTTTPVLTLNTVSIAKGGTGQTTQTTAFNALSPLTTKGDVLVHNGTNNIRLGVGSDGQALVADSSQASGVKWADILATDILSLTTTGIVQRNGAGSYSTVTVNAPLSYAAGALGVSVGTTAGTVAAGDDSRITGALQKSGGMMSGAINMGSQDLTSVGNIAMSSNKTLGLSSNAADPGSPSVGQVWYNSTANTIMYYDGSSVKTLGVTNLDSAKIWVGNGSNVATAVFMSGDVSIDNAGATSLGSGVVTSGKILDGTITGSDVNSSAALSVASVSTSGNISIGGALTVTSSISAPSFNYTSDRRLKTNIVEMSGLETILKLRGVRFNWIKNGQPEVGLIAQEVEKVVPELVIQDPKTGLKAVKYGNIVSPLIEATKEIYGLCLENRNETQGVVREVASLKNDVADLKRENEFLRNEIQQIKQMLAKEK